VIGEKRYPATEDLTGLSLFYHRLRKMAEGTAITREMFANNSFVASFNLEAAEQVQHTGVSTNNAPLNIFVAGLYGAGETDTKKAKALFTTTISDELLELTNRGVVVGN
jgi:signal recognition particle GTPase